MRSWKRLSVVGLEHFRGLPPALLRFEDGAFWGTELALEVVPSLPLAHALALRPKGPLRKRPSLALFANLDPGAGALARWPNLARRGLEGAEIERLTAAFPGSPKPLVGRAVTRDAVLGRDLSGMDVVHFFVHGVHLDDRERGAALALYGGSSTPELLTCEDVEERLCLGGVVLLSACATARGPDRPGDDNLAHLGGAFLRAGARAVVLAQVPIELEATLDLMTRMHAGLAVGSSPAESLRTALVSASKSTDPLTIWQMGQFVVLGAGQAPCQ